MSLRVDAQHAAVAAREADRASAGLLDELDDLAIDLAAEHHLDDFHRLVVGDAQAVDEGRLLADARERRLDLRTAAVDDHRPHADVLEQHDVDREGGLEGIVLHRVAAVLDDDGLAQEAPHVGQRLDQDPGLVDQLLHALPVQRSFD